ncbi:hypothetical protein ACIG47_12590 [Promicromonospora sp. NPDC052451]|uniref:hypothetical protein n=1 Tax=unclassified Promicromonospora TaxID=2647929 RepID=UPI0037C77CA2
MNHKRIRTAVLTALVALGVGLGAVAPAQAAAYEVNYTEPRAYSSHSKDCASVDRYQACVQPYGDLIWIKDGLKDGESPFVTWTDLDGDRSGMCINRQGVDAGWTACNKNFPEGHEIRWTFTWRNYDGTWESSAYQYTVV